ncbi:DUF3616 domain-containing protein [Methylobacterium sp. Leaf456]|uniref:DUF3616 domain-containing protein n=1 Tax=Methylobacterium sp. Leaf456 TaxID=1736382 RepID=UPI0012E3E527|nr:DUF3616 domain-containing protein [Methylobacterium sp. Leaf456]
MRSFLRLSTVLSALFTVAPAMASEPILQPDPQTYELAGDLWAPGKDEAGQKNVAEDISGIACIDLGGGKRRCLLINDEGGKAQFATIEDFRIEPKKRVDLIGEGPNPATLGRQPKEPGCPDPRQRFKELDGEGVAYAAPYFYVTGSHGCARRAKAFTLSAMLLARIRVTADGKADVAEGAEPEGAVETTWRLGDALARAETVGAHFLKDLTDENGLNIEGLAVVGDDLYAGLRAPSLDGKAFLVAVSVEALFAKGHEPYAGTPRVIPIEVGEGAGIRDLTVLPDGQLLVLTGPAQFQDVPYRLFRFDPKGTATPVALGRLAPLDESEKRGKPEAITLVGGDRVLVFFDSLRNGAPRSYTVPGRR